MQKKVVSLHCENKIITIRFSMSAIIVNMMKYILSVYKVVNDIKILLSVHYYSNKYDMTCDIEDWIDESQDDVFYEFRKLINDPFRDKL